MLDLALPLNVLALASAFDLNVLYLASPMNMLELASPLNVLELASPWNQILQRLIWSGTMSMLTRPFRCYVDAIACPSAMRRLKLSWPNNSDRYALSIVFLLGSSFFHWCYVLAQPLCWQQVIVNVALGCAENVVLLNFELRNRSWILLNHKECLNVSWLNNPCRWNLGFARRRAFLQHDGK